MKIKGYIKQKAKSVLLKIVLPILYRFHSRKEINPNKCVFADARGAKIPFHMELMRDECIRMGNEVVEFYADFSKCGIRELIRQISGFIKEYATCRCVFICDYYMPVYGCKRRDGTSVVQLWHGSGLFKKFGYATEDDIPKSFTARAHTNYTLVTVSAEISRESYARAMDVDVDIIKALGISSTDMLFDDEYIDGQREEFFRRYPHLEGKKIITYAPSFRGSASSPDDFELPDFDKLSRDLGEEYALLIKLHPLMYKRVGDLEALPSNCYNCGGEDIYRLLIVSSALVSDYSAIINEASLLGRAVLFYAPDLDEYQSKRGFFINYREDLPGSICATTEELSAHLRDLDRYDYENLAAFASKFMGACDGNSTRRIYEDAMGKDLDSK